MRAGRFLRAVAATVSDLRGISGDSLPGSDGPLSLGAGGASPPRKLRCLVPETGSSETAFALRRLAGVRSRDAGAPPVPVERFSELALPSRRQVEVCLLDAGASPLALTWSEVLVASPFACALLVRSRAEEAGPPMATASAVSIGRLASRAEESSARWFRLAQSCGGGASPRPMSGPTGSA